MADENELADMEAHLRSLGQQADTGEIDPSELSVQDENTVGSSTTAESETATSETAAAEGQSGAGEESSSERSASSAATSENDSTKEAAKTDTPAKDETPYERAKREGKKREAEAWKKIEAEKAQIARQKAELDAAKAQREQTQQQQQQAEAPEAKPHRDEKGYTAAEYDQAAEGFDAEGDVDMARLARQKAAQVRQVETQQRAHAQQQQFISTWKQHMEAEIAANPELKDTKSELGQAVTRILQGTPALSRTPDGFRHAVRLAKEAKDGAAVPALRQQLDKLTKENQRLTKLTSLTGTGPAKQAGNEGKELSEADLRRMAHEADGSAAA